MGTHQTALRGTAARILLGRLLLLGALLVCAFLVFTVAAQANTVTISGSMEGAIKISNGDFVAAGYQFTIPGGHPDTHVTIAQATVTITGPCSNGGTDTVTIPLKAGPYDDPANSSEWFPEGKEEEPATFQGSVVASVCGGTGTLDASKGATFHADVQADQTANELHIRFHYRDPNAKGKGNFDCASSSSQGLAAAVCGASWSSTAGLVPDRITPAFTIEKLHEIFGSGGAFTTAPLTGEVGESVDYEIIVTNTGSTALTFGNLTDERCESIAGGPGGNALEAGAATTFTCEHVLTLADQLAGRHENNATITGTPPEGSPITHTSNTVIETVPTPKRPDFETKKEQRLSGEASYTTAKLTGKLGQTVEYKITVKDTGNTTLALGALSDPKCDAGTISAASQSPIAPGETAFYTCSHVLDAVGIYTNVAVVTATPPGEPPISHETPPVEVEVPAGPAFEIKKEQRFEGEASYTTAKLIGKLGQTVEYKITVKDTGNTTLALGALSDPKCDAGTISAASQSPIAPGETAFYTCSHVLDAVGIYTNVAVVTATPPGEPPISHETPPVEVNVPPATSPAPKAQVSPFVAAAPALKGPQGCVRQSFTVSVKAASVASVTFYLDGHKLRTLSAKNAHNGQLRITIGTAKLRLGAHKLVAKITMVGSPKPAAVTRSLTVVRCASPFVAPRFTG